MFLLKLLCPQVMEKATAHCSTSNFCSPWRLGVHSALSLSSYNKLRSFYRNNSLTFQRWTCSTVAFCPDPHTQTFLSGSLPIRKPSMVCSVLFISMWHRLQSATQESVFLCRFLQGNKRTSFSDTVNTVEFIDFMKSTCLLKGS